MTPGNKLEVVAVVTSLILVVLNNRGTTIVLGMSQGPIEAEGYTKEVRELYVFEKVK